MRRARIESEFKGMPPASISALPRRAGSLRVVGVVEASDGELDELSRIFAVPERLLLTLERNRAEPIRGELRDECPRNVDA